MKLTIGAIIMSCIFALATYQLVEMSYELGKLSGILAGCQVQD